MTLLKETAAVFTAVGTVAVAVLAIWGDWVRDRFAGPKLVLSLRNSRGDVNTRNDGKSTIYYHLDVTNARAWSPAKEVRVLVTAIAKRRPDDSYFPEPIVAPLQLTWAFPTFHVLFPTIGPPDTCDFGFLLEGGKFSLSTYVTPNNFSGYVAKGEAIRVQVMASAHNGQSKPITIEVSWDGFWSTNLDEIQRHLVLKQL
jgi:hypothetical protein